MSSTTALKHVLVVDDNLADVGLIRQATEGVSDLELHVAHSVPQAHSYLNNVVPHGSNPVPDLILLDLRMPMLPGNTLIPLVRYEPHLKNIRIVVFSSSALESDREECRRLGADDYVLKPCDWINWQATISQILAQLYSQK